MIGTTRNPLATARVQISGEMDKRLRLGLRHLLQESGRLIGGEGHTQGWGPDGVGRWISAVARTAACTRQSVPELDKVVHDLIAVQKPDGSWGPEASWVDWGNSRGMAGLAEYWELTRDAAALASLRKAAEYYCRRSEEAAAKDPANPPFNPRGGIEGLLAAWRVTGDSRSLHAAEQAAAYATRNDVFLPRHIHMHVDLLTPLGGLVDLYLVTGTQAYLSPARDIHAEVLANEMWVTGGICEFRDNPFETRDETCQVSDWLRLSFRLWQATGSARYMDVAEHTLVNHLFFNQDHSGGFCYSRYLAPAPALQRDLVAWFCCSMHGVQALAEAVRFIYTQDQESIDVNLYTPSRATITLGDGEVSLEQETRYPGEPGTRITVGLERPLAFCLRLRVPHWARAWSLALNGSPATADENGGYASLTRTWQPGDTVEISFTAGLQVVPRNANSFAMAHTAPPAEQGPVRFEQAALVHGPLVLMVDPALLPHQMYDWDRVEILVPRNGDGEPFLPRATRAIPGRGEFAVPNMCFMTLGRSTTQLARRDKSIFDPDAAEHVHEDTRQAAPDLADGSWKLVFLVPVSELTDRWTATMHRLAPYEVRTDQWLLPAGQAPALQERVRQLLEVVYEQKWLRTTGFLMKQYRKGTPSGA